MNICIFGDSITWGAYDPEQGGWATRLRNYFESEDSPPYFREAGDVQVYNLGVSGDTVDDLLERIETEAKSRNPDLIIFAIGINDAQFINSKNSLSVSPEQFQGNIEKLAAIAKKFAGKIIFVGLTRVDELKTVHCPWRPDVSYFNESINKLDDTIRKFCKENELKYIPLADVIGKNNLFDGLHPNTQGHIKIFNKVRSGIIKFLKI